MKSSFIRKSFLFAAAVGFFSLAGDEADERNMGNDAFSRYDYKGAVRFYRNALLLADAAHWSEDALLLARAQLRAGDLNGARKTFAEYQKRNPGDELSAGMFPGELLLAEKNYIEAARYFSRLATKLMDPDENRAVRFAAASAFAAAGEFLTAENIFLTLESDCANAPEWARRVHFGCIETLIQGQFFERAGEMLAQRKYENEVPEKYRYLELQLQARKRDVEKFMQLWEKLPADHDSHERYELALMGAEAAQQNNAALPQAVILLRAALEHAMDEEVQKYVLREIINVETVNSALNAAGVISEYLKRWPDDPDRSDLLLRQARLYASQQETSAASDVYQQLIAGGETPHDLRITACREAAVIADNSGNIDLSENILQRFLAFSRDANEKEEALLLLGELHLKKEDYSRAEECFRVALEQKGLRSADIHYRLLQSLMGQKKYRQAAETVQILSLASQREHRAAASYYKALIDARNGKVRSAREQFLTFLKEFPWSEHLSNAAYHAAVLAFEDHQYRTAAAELLAYVRQYPDSALTESSLVLAIRSAGISRDTELAAEITGELDKRHPDGNGRLEARLILADTLYVLGKIREAEELLLDTGKMVQKNLPVRAALLYQNARIALARKQTGAALKYLEEILEYCPDVPAVPADAAYIAANLYADDGKYARAVELYKRALELNPSGIFAQLCEGRMADAELSLYKESSNPDHLNAAAERYRKLSVSSDYSIRLQSCCKLGRVLELSGKYEEALRAYEETLYIAANMKRQKLAADCSLWAGKAANAALALCSREDIPKRSDVLKRISNWISELEIPLTTGLENKQQDQFTTQEKGL